MRKDALSQLKKEGIFVSEIPALEDHFLKSCFIEFLQKPKSYKAQYLQKEFSYAFDGYSFQGQTDSSNQGHDDLLDTFVFSDLRSASEFPKAFINYLNIEWNETLKQIKALENEVLKSLNLKINQNDLGHMVSCNYYPPISNFDKTARENSRLSAHPDVSLFTVFPFGVQEGFSYQNKKGEWKKLEANKQWTIFNGYLLETLTNGEMKALNHKVELPNNREEERFSFAYFSIPRQNTSMNMNGKLIDSKTYFKTYLSLFD